MRLVLALAALLLLGASGAVHAQAPACPIPTFTVVAGSSITLTWLAPTTNTDGSPITPVSGTAVTYTLYNAAVSPPAKIASGLTTTSSVRSALVVGTPCYAVTATVNGIESGFSNAASLTVLPAPPNPPKGLTCTVVIPAGGAPVTGNCTTSP